MARIKGPRKVHQYSEDFKVTAVKLSHLPGVQVKDVAEELDIHPFMLSHKDAQGRGHAQGRHKDAQGRARTGSRQGRGQVFTFASASE
ncbi:MAG TPA: hypothetical protein ENJ68_03960 [Devosia sp.]|nr:hypothetical protein [Devosia sp.]